MRIFRMFLTALRLAWPYLWAPWRSPLLRWRMETYGLMGPSGRPLHAEEIGPAQAIRFAIRNRRALVRFLRWASGIT